MVKKVFFVWMINIEKLQVITHNGSDSLITILPSKTTISENLKPVNSQGYCKLVIDSK